MDKKWRKSIFNSCHSMVDISWPSLLNGHLAAIKSFILQKRSKNSLKCFRGQILSDTKTTGNQCWNAQETHRPHDLSIGKDHLLSQKQESSSAYSTRIFKVQVLNDQALFLCWTRMDQGGLHCLTKASLSDALLLYSQFPVVKSGQFLFK